MDRASAWTELPWPPPHRSGHGGTKFNDGEAGGSRCSDTGAQGVGCARKEALSLSSSRPRNFLTRGLLKQRQGGGETRRGVTGTGGGGG